MDIVEYDDVTILNGINIDGFKYIQDLYLNRGFKLSETEKKIIYNYFNLLSFNNEIFEDGDNFVTYFNNLTTDNYFKENCWFFLDMVFMNMNLELKKQWLTMFLKKYILSEKLEISAIIVFSKYIFKNSALRILSSSDDIDYFPEIINSLLSRFDCSDQSQLDELHKFSVWLIRNLPNNLFINEIYSYLSIGQIKNTYNYQINEYDKLDYEKDKILQNILYLSIKLWQRGIEMKEIKDVQLECLIDPESKLKFKDNIPIKNIIDLKFKKLLNNKDNLDLEHNIYLPEKYTLLSHSFVFVICAFNVTLTNYTVRSSYTIKEINYWKKQIDKLEKIKEGITIESKLFYNNFNKKIKEINTTLSHLTNKNKLFKSSLNNIDLNNNINDFFNKFFNCIEVNMLKNKNIYYHLPEQLISNFFNYAIHNLSKKKTHTKHIYNFSVQNISDKENYPNLHTRCKFSKYCIKYMNEYMKSPNTDMFDVNSVSSIIKLIVSMEKDQNALDFYDRLEPRFYFIDFLYRVLENNQLRKKFSENLLTENTVQAVFLILNDYNSLMDDIFEKIIMIHEHEHYIININHLQLINYQKVIKTYFDFIFCIEDLLLSLAKYYPEYLIDKLVIKKLLSQINFNIYKLLGPGSDKLIIKDHKKYSFDKKKMLHYYANLLTILYSYNNELIIPIICEDKRSYDKVIYDKLFRLLPDISSENIILKNLLDRTQNEDIFQSFNIRNKFKGFISELDEFSLADDIFDSIDIPNEFEDPLLNSLIEEPVELPNTQMIISRNTIQTHLMSSNENPFDRSELTQEILDNYNNIDEVRIRINVFLDKLNNWKQLIIDKYNKKKILEKLSDEIKDNKKISSKPPPTNGTQMDYGNEVPIVENIHDKQYDNEEQIVENIDDTLMDDGNEEQIVENIDDTRMDDGNEEQIVENTDDTQMDDGNEEQIVENTDDTRMDDGNEEQIVENTDDTQMDDGNEEQIVKNTDDMQMDDGNEEQIVKNTDDMQMDDGNDEQIVENTDDMKMDDGNNEQIVENTDDMQMDDGNNEQIVENTDDMQMDDGNNEQIVENTDDMKMDDGNDEQIVENTDDMQMDDGNEEQIVKNTDDMQNDDETIL